MSHDVYISSSWKNRQQVRALALALRDKGISVYDFTDPACRKEPELPPEAFPEQFDPDVHNYEQYLRADPRYEAAVFGNLTAIRQCKVVLLLLPCGNDSHADWALGVGLGKLTAIVGHPRKGERTPSHLWADAFLKGGMDAIEWTVSQLDIMKQAKAEQPKGSADRLW